jgi:hypothetical protein
VPFTAGAIETAGDALIFGDNRKALKLEDLEELAAKPKR